MKNEGYPFGIPSGRLLLLWLRKRESFNFKKTLIIVRPKAAERTADGGHRCYGVIVL